MKIRELFLELTQRTYPHGTEDQLLEYLPNGVQRDEWGNYWIKIGDSNTIFSSHLDTYSKEVQKVNHKFVGDIITTKGDTILGGDDKSGVVILIHMIQMGVEGLYYFFSGEEVGCIGSQKVSEKIDTSSYGSIISLDRKGFGSIITHQSLIRTCSDEFSHQLQSEFLSHGMDYHLDRTGVWCDSAVFSKKISECTNISTGYMDEHTPYESQRIDFLEKLSHVMCQIDFKKLTTYRDPNMVHWEGNYLPEGSGKRNKNIMKNIKKTKPSKTKEKETKKEKTPKKIIDPFSDKKTNLLGF